MVLDYRWSVTSLDGQSSPLFPSSCRLSSHLPWVSFQSSLFFPPVFFIPLFLLRILPLSVHHPFLDKDYIHDLSATLGSGIIES